MPTNLQQRVAVFVDVQNMFYAARQLYGSKLNFARLLDYIARERPLVRALAYVVQTPEIDQSNFLAMLRSNGYEVRSKDLKQRPDGSAKGDWDMGLALDALAISDRLDVVAIVSGDGDFVDLVNFLKARGVRVEVYSFPYSTAEELRYAATEYYQMGTEMVMNPQARPSGSPLPPNVAGRLPSYSGPNYGMPVPSLDGVTEYSNDGTGRVDVPAPDYDEDPSVDPRDLFG
jgi:uncharacterized LabA/DUF88 family protein